MNTVQAKRPSARFVFNSPNRIYDEIRITPRLVEETFDIEGIWHNPGGGTVVHIENFFRFSDAVHFVKVQLQASTSKLLRKEL